MSAVLRQIYEGEFMYDLFHGEGKMFGTQHHADVRCFQPAASKATGESCCTIFEAEKWGVWNPLKDIIQDTSYSIL